MSKGLNGEPKYDVAISFLDQQRALALRIKDGLSDRLTTFVFSEEQSELVGRYRDGVEGFTHVFRHDCRVCVVLHTEGWGKKGMTHVEEAALKERALYGGQGWDFLIVVRLDDAAPPDWIPKAKIYYGFKQFGLQGLLGAIDIKVTELGGRPKEDSILEKAARIERERQFEERKELFGRSLAGFNRANEEIARFEKVFEDRVEQLAKVSPKLELKFAKYPAQLNKPTFAAVSPRASFVLYWQPQYANSLTNAALLIVEWGGRFSYSAWGGGPPKLGSFHAIPTIDYADKVVWQLEDKEEPLTSEALFDYCFERLLTHANEPRPRTRDEMREDIIRHNLGLD